MDVRRPGRAAPLPPDERRRAIVAAVVPLLIEHGGEVSTRLIAEAAGIAEGTIFRVFPDKAALFQAVAEDTMDPARARAELTRRLEGLTGLRERVHAAAEQLDLRLQRTMVIMWALRGLGPLAPDAANARDRKPGPPPFMIEANRELLATLAEVVFEPHREQLRVAPETAAAALRAIVFGSRHPGVPGAQLTPADIADLLVDGLADPTTKDDRTC